MPRRPGSRQWLKEHFDDPYVKQAQKEGYRARAVYKLLEIQQRDKILRPGMTVVDLGAAPGSWAEVAAKIVGSKGRVIALDILPIMPITGVEIIEGDFTDEGVLEDLLKRIDHKPIDLVMSDMAPNLSGIAEVDQARAMNLAELAFDFAKQVLKPKGTLLVKVFQGEGFDAFLLALRKDFSKVFVRKPKASRPRSKEVYLLACGLKV